VSNPSEYNAKGLATEIKWVADLDRRIQLAERELKDLREQHERAKERLYTLGQQILSC